MPFPMTKKSTPSASDLGAMEPFDKKPAPKTPPMQREEQEPPTEEYGEKLIADIVRAGEGHGLDAEQSKAVAADFFTAAAGCLRGDSEQEPQAEDAEMPTERGYGR